MMYQVIEIIEPDFGCEGIPDGEEPMCDVVLESEDKERLHIQIPDAELYRKNICEGTMVTLIDGMAEKVD